jgi:hypothetical protein
LTSEVVQEFLLVRRSGRVRAGTSERAWAPLLGYLRRLGVVPPPTVMDAVTPVDVLLSEYRRYAEARDRSDECPRLLGVDESDVE